MKKIRFIIISTYVVVVALITLLTIIFVARVFLKGSDLYFKEPTQKEAAPLPSLDINETIKILKDFKIL